MGRGRISGAAGKTAAERTGPVDISDQYAY